MAKIILVTKTITATSWQLALALKAQQHDVVVLTSYKEEPMGSSHGIQFMAYFKKWSFAEGLKIIPGLFGLQPQILHLLLDEDKMSPAQIILSGFARSHPTCVLTTSLLFIRKRLSRLNPVRYLIEESDIITCPTVEALGYIRGLNVREHQQGRGILPPVLDLSSSTLKEDTYLDELEEIEDFTSRPYIVVPFREEKFTPFANHFHRLLKINQKYRVILWGSFDGWSLRQRKRFAQWMDEHQGKGWLITSQLTLAQTQYLLGKAEALYLAGQALSPVEVTDYYMKAISAHAVMILDSRQTKVHGDLWKNAQNCWILRWDAMSEDLEKVLLKANLKVPENVADQLAEDRHLIDSSLNELNRLYNKALAHLR